METHLPSPPPRALPGLVDDLRTELEDAGFTHGGLEQLLGPVAGRALHREQPLPALRALRDAPLSSLTVLTKMFCLGRRVPVVALRRTLSALTVDDLVAMGLVRLVPMTPREVERALSRRSREDEANHQWAHACCDLRPYGEDDREWWVASDLPEIATGEPLDVDHVLGIGGASTTLASWTPRPRAARALDLGTGCGVQALHLAEHADTLVATDISERALAYARFNAELNGVQIDLREGSFTEPVAGEAFDLIVSNPPFVITPRTEDVPLYEYRDGGQQADDVTSGLMVDIAARLAPGGIAQMLGNWEIGAGADWRDRVRTWAQATGVDVWVIQRDVEDPAQYAETWARDGGHQPGDLLFETMYEAWLDDFAARGTEGIGFGVVTMHRPQTGRQPWIDLEEVLGAVEAPMGPTVLRGIRARSWLADRSDDAVLDVAWSVADDVTEERFARPGASDPAVIRLRQGGGLRRAVQVDTATAGLVSVMDGSMTAAQALTAIAALTGEDEMVLRREVASTVRALVADGLLV